jgi:probable rRNA maturation factor
VTDCPPTAADAQEGATSSIYLPPFRIDVTVRPGVAHIVSRHRIAQAVRAALDIAGAPGPASISVVLSADCELAELNAVHMGASGATDVLSFPFFPPEAFPAHERVTSVKRDPWVAAALAQAFALPPGLRAHLGDIIVSVERAIAQAEDGRGGQTGDVLWTPVEELLLLTVHGTLHVCGWDHAEPVEEAAMRGMESRVLDLLRKPEPEADRSAADASPIDGMAAVDHDGAASALDVTERVESDQLEAARAEAPSRER